jgi:hypothetical protein
MLTYNTVPHFVNQKSRNVRGPRRRRQFTRAGERAAVLRAFFAARAYAEGRVSTLEEAAASTASSIDYVRAALTLLKSGDKELISDALYGNISIITAAAQVKYAVKAIENYNKLPPANRERFRIATGATADLGEHIIHSAAQELIAAVRKVGGGEVIFDKMVAPVLTPAAEPVVTVVTPAE